jgi:hypothetical protein
MSRTGGGQDTAPEEKEEGEEGQGGLETADIYTFWNASSTRGHSFPRVTDSVD